ncbi:glycosyltransferase family 39 protein [Anaerolinea thermophila]|uniref:glycosyltransferase family 39 protein n=2 Tax=Anaerolinea TaxID=233189 RepID=UPI0026F233F7|nr:glycosyltransferase family 39 protein [Anaerolinea thermophila]
MRNVLKQWRNSRTGEVLLVLMLLAAGLWIRLYDLDDPPLDFHPTRQLHSLILARGMYLADAPGVPEWQRERARLQARAEGIVEPPVMEMLAVGAYRLLGREVPLVGRLYALMFWVTGALGGYLLMRRWLSAPLAAVGLGFLLFFPYGVIASRSFQPDPLMVALILWSLWALTGWWQTQSWRWCIAAGILSGLTLLIKATAGFMLFFPLAVLLWTERSRFSRRMGGQLLALGGLASLPLLGYSLYGWFVVGYLQQQMSLRFFPQYWMDAVFYLRWASLLTQTFGLAWMAFALLGTMVLPVPLRAIAFGGWMGYVALGLALPHHISTHDYYSLPLLPFMALGMAGMVSVFLQRLAEPRRLWQAGMALVLLGTAVWMLYETRNTLRKSDYRAEPAFWQSLAEQMGRDARVIGLLPDYGARLTYWGWITPTAWWTQAEMELRRRAGQDVDVQALLQEQTRDRDYFVITLMDEWQRQKALQDFLVQYPLIRQSDTCLIFDLRTNRGN